MRFRNGRQRLSWRYKPFPELTRLSWPIVVQLISFSVMTMVDTLFVGRLGATSLAAVGIGGSALFTILSFAAGLYSGAKVRVSQAAGAGRDEENRALLGAFFKLGIILALGLSAVVFVGLELLPFASPQAETVQLSQSYLAFRALGLPGAVAVFALAQYRQGLGDSRSAMRAALGANLVNVPLNALFIFGVGWGVAGAALATVFARAVELTLLLAAVGRSQPTAGGDAGVRIHPFRSATWAEAWELFRFAVPTAVERFLDSAAMAALVLLLGRMGTVQVAAHQVVLQVVHLCILPSIAVGEALSVLVAQAMGARDARLVRRLAAFAALLGGTYTLLAVAALGLLRDRLLWLFTDSEPVLSAARPTLVAAMALLIIHVPYSIGKSVLRGISDLRYGATVVVLCAWVFTPPLTYVFGEIAGLGAAGGWWALVVETSVAVLLLWARLMHKAQEKSRRPVLRGAGAPAMLRG